MITQKQFEELNVLRCKLEELINFRATLVREHGYIDIGITEVGLVDREPELSRRYNHLFLEEFTDVKDRFKKSLLEEVDIRIKGIENKMSLYLTKE